MMVRALICCAALILGLLATLGATAQSYAVCSGATCRTVEKARPLDLMAFMRGSAKTSTKTAAKSTGGKAGKHRHGTSRPAARPDNAPDIPLAKPRPADLPAEAASAYAAHAENDVQVVTGDQLNAIDLAMLRSAPETDGTAQQADSGVRFAATDATADASQARDAVFDPNSVGASPTKPESQGNEAVRDHARDNARDDARDDSWMGRLWSAVGDGFVALVAMVRQLFS